MNVAAYAVEELFKMLLDEDPDGSISRDEVGITAIDVSVPTYRVEQFFEDVIAQAKRDAMDSALALIEEDGDYH